jgi:triphosphoribosyl-dephospho-CoA synthase
MAEAAAHDRIAAQYVSDFEDIFARGLPLFAAKLSHGFARKWAAMAVYLHFMATFADSHVVRKHGSARADAVRQAAEGFALRLRSAHDPEVLLPDLLAWDAALKAQAVNPGTSADLTVATLFAHRLQDILPSACGGD